MTNCMLNVRCQKVNASGIFLSIAKGAIQPILAIILVPLALFIPPVVAFIYYHVFTNQQGKFFKFNKGFTNSFDLKTVIATELMYLALMYAALKFVGYKLSIYLQEYEEIAKQSGVLQLGTKEQLTYSHNLTLLLSALGIFTLVLFIVINGICYLKASAKANALISPDLKTSLKLVFLAMVKNLPVYLLFTVAVVFIFALLEMYYARLKLIYLQGYILGQDIFNPSILFIIIRVYLVHIITYALGLFTYTALGFQNKICFKD